MGLYKMAYKIISTVIRSTVAYIVILILARLIGRKLISRITFFDFVVGVTLGSLAVHISLGNETSEAEGIASAITITLLVLLTDLLNNKSYLFRKIEEGTPIVLISKGEFLEHNMAKAKISITKLLMLLRQKDIFDIESVNYAIIENDGQLSVLLKAERMPVSAYDLNIKKPENELPVDVIVDGKIIRENLNASKYSENWLKKQLQLYGIKDAGQVFYASINKPGHLFVSAFHNKNNLQ